MATDTAVSECRRRSLDVIVKTDSVKLQSVEIKQIQNWPNESAAGDHKDSNSGATRMYAIYVHLWYCFLMLLCNISQKKSLYSGCDVGPNNTLVCEANFETKLRFSFVPVPDFFEDGLPLPAQAYLKVCSAVSEASLSDVKPSSPPAILGSPPKEAALPSSGTTVQRRSVLHTEEIVRLSTTVFKYQSRFSFLFIYK